MDLKALGEKMAERKQELQAEMGIAPEDEEPGDRKLPARKRNGTQRHPART